MSEKNPFDGLFEEDGEQYARPRTPDRPAGGQQPDPGHPGQGGGTPQGYPGAPAQGYPYPTQQGYPNQGYAYPNQGYPAGPNGQQHPQPGYGQHPFSQQAPAPYVRGPQKSRIAAGLLGVFLGGFGVHRFYLGNNGVGAAQLILTVFTGTGAIWGFVEGLMILCNARSFQTDARGIPLK